MIDGGTRRRRVSYLPQLVSRVVDDPGVPGGSQMRQAPWVRRDRWEGAVIGAGSWSGRISYLPKLVSEWRSMIQACPAASNATPYV